MDTKFQNGFTLYELLITVLVIGVILTLGVPNLQEFTANSRITTTANDLHASFLLARSEAARAKTNITICASNDSMSANPSCSMGSFDDGWIVFIDTDGDIVRGAGENVLRVLPAIDSAIDITTNAGASYFSFAATGLGRGDVGGLPSLQSARICDGRGNVTAAGGSSAARVLIVTPIGRATVIRDPVQITAQGDCP